MFTKQIVVAQKSTGLVFGPYSCLKESDAYTYYERETGSNTRRENLELAYLTLGGPDVIDARTAAWQNLPLGNLYQERALDFERNRARRDREDAAYCGRAW